MFSSSSRLRAHGGTDKDTMLPVEGLIDKWHPLWPPAAKDDGINGDPLWVFPGWIYDGALGGWGAKPGNEKVCYGWFSCPK